MNSRNCPFLLAFLVFFSFSLFAQPTIGFFSPSSGPVGTSVTITGTNFSPTAAANVVYFGAVRAVVNAATPTSVTVTVPAGAVQQPLSLTVNNLTVYSAQPFMVTYPGGGTLAGRSFEQPENVATSLYPYGLALGDFDNDGKPDVATVNNANVPASYVAVHRNTGGNGVVSFAPQNNLSIGDNGFGITTADFDGDGKLDLAATYIASNGNVSIYKNNSTGGNISFAPAVTYAAGSSPYTIAAGDVDGDGKPDLVICNYTGNSISVLRNTTASGVVSFAPKLTFTTALAPYDLALGDLDGDGKLDVVTSNSLSNNVSALRNTSMAGTVSFAPKIDYSTGSSPRGVAIGDLDGDSKPEVAFVNNVDNTVSVLRNGCTPGSFAFAARINFSIPAFSSSNSGRIAISDLDADTKADLIVSSDYVYLFKNNGSPGTLSFGPALTYVTLTPYRIGVADLDVDGKPDVAITNVSYQSFSVFRNRVPAPQLSSISPTTAAAGTSVTINGYNLTGATNVWFGDVPATSYIVNSANKITAVVGTGASGNVKVSTLYGTDSLGSFVFAGPPVISSASPTSAATGDTVFITGQNFNNATAVAFGGTVASYFTVVSPGMIKAVVGSGASGALTVTTQYGTGSFNGFVYLPLPAVTSFTPVTAATGTPVSITGRNFTGTTAVSFGGVAASSFTVVSPLQINAVVGNGASGSISVTNAYGTGTLAGFTYLPPPVIASFMPTSAGPSMMVTINGTNFGGTTNVSFGGTNATSFTVVSPTKITAFVSSLGASGSVSVTNTGGTGSLAGFTFVPAPTIVSFSPKLTGTGGSITINGTNLSTATSVTIGGVAAASFTVVNATTITAVVGTGAASGSISLTTLGGTANGTQSFYFTTSPVISSFSPRSAAIGATITITGVNFAPSPANNVVYFGGVKATVSSATQHQLVATVPAGAHYGPITVTANNQTAYSLLPFAVTFSGGGPFTASSFAGRIDFATSGKPASMAAGDLDSDGRPDAVVANTYSGTLSFFRNTSTAGSLSFAAKIDSNAGTNPHNIKLADIDGDGKLDVLCLNNLPFSTGSVNDNTISIFRNKSTAGNLSFEPRLVINTRQCPWDLAVADLNLDGKPDLALTYSCFGGPQIVWLYRNTSLLGNISFFQPQELVVSTDAASDYFAEDAITVADIDRDDRPDLVVGFGNGTFFSVAYNKATVGGAFLGMQYECYSNNGSCWLGPGYGSAANADFNGDDKVDILTSDRIVQNTSGSFVAFNHRTVYGIGGMVAIDGLSGSAKPDFVRVNSSANTFSAVKNTSTTDTVKFAPDVNYPTGTTPSGIVTADFDGDGKVDVAVANKDFNTFSVFLNKTASAGLAISSFSPMSGTTGTVVTITGSGFIGVTNVSIGDMTVGSFTVLNSTTITAVVGNNASGNLSVTTAAGTASLGWFYRTPSITSFTPSAAGTGLTVTITGTDFTGTTAVSVGGTASASFTVVSPTRIDAVVGAGATGSISVTTPGGTATKAGFMYVVAPVVTSFSPASGPQGTVVTISGSNFTGATSVRFGVTEASSFTVVSQGIITAVVGSGSTGGVFVTTPGGTDHAINQQFTFIAPPVITSFSPASGVPGSTITITGTGFTGANSVAFGGTAAASFTVVNSTTLTAVVGNGASGNVSITAPGGTASSPGFSFNFPTGLQAMGNTVDRLLIFPNPSGNSITVSHPSVPGVSTLQVTDMYGRLIKEIVLKRNASQSQVTLQGLSAGVYKIVWSDGKIASGAILFKK